MFWEISKIQSGWPKNGGQKFFEVRFRENPKSAPDIAEMIACSGFVIPPCFNKLVIRILFSCLSDNERTEESYLGV